MSDATHFAAGFTLTFSVIAAGALIWNRYVYRLWCAVGDRRVAWRRLHHLGIERWAALRMLGAAVEEVRNERRTVQVEMYGAAPGTTIDHTTRMTAMGAIAAARIEVAELDSAAADVELEMVTAANRVLKAVRDAVTSDGRLSVAHVMDATGLDEETVLSVLARYNIGRSPS